MNPFRQTLKSAGSQPPPHDLLLDASRLIAAVKLRSDAPILGAVLRDVGVEQIQRNPPDLDAPDFE